LSIPNGRSDTDTVRSPGVHELWFGPVRTEKIALPPGGTSEVVFQAGRDPYAGCGGGPFWPATAYLIDDLRVE
jgi:hypothetical protein